MDRTPTTSPRPGLSRHGLPRGPSSTSASSASSASTTAKSPPLTLRSQRVLNVTLEPHPTSTSTAKSSFSTLPSAPLSPPITPFSPSAFPSDYGPSSFEHDHGCSCSHNHSNSSYDATKPHQTQSRPHEYHHNSRTGTRTQDTHLRRRRSLQDAHSHAHSAPGSLPFRHVRASESDPRVKERAPSPPPDAETEIPVSGPAATAAPATKELIASKEAWTREREREVRTQAEHGDQTNGPNPFARMAKKLKATLGSSSSSSASATHNASSTSTSAAVSAPFSLSSGSGSGFVSGPGMSAAGGRKDQRGEKKGRDAVAAWQRRREEVQFEEMEDVHWTEM